MSETSSSGAQKAKEVPVTTFKRYDKDLVFTVCPEGHSIRAYDGGGGRSETLLSFSCNGTYPKDMTFSASNHTNSELHFQFTVDMYSLVRGGSRFFTYSSPWNTCSPVRSSYAYGGGNTSVRVKPPAVFGELINTDIIKIYVHINILKASKACPDSPALAKEQKNAINYDMAKGFFVPEYTDFTLISQGKKIPCHRFLLACRSKVFLGMLLPGMKEADLEEHEITDSSPKAVRDLLYFVYTNRLLDLRSGPLIALLDLARRYDVYSLEEKCTENLVAALHVTNVLRVAEVARTMNLTRLRIKAVQYLARQELAKRSDVRMGAVKAGKGMPNEITSLLAARANCGGPGTKRLKQRFPR